MLPPVGDCSSCASTLHDTPVPSLLDRDIRIDRRTAERAAEPAFVEAAHAPPSVAPLAAPLPPPAAPRAAAPQAAPPGVAAPRMPAQPPGVAAPRAAPPAAAPRMAPAQPPPPGVAPRVAPVQVAQPPAAPRAAQPPAAFSPMTPAYGTPTAPAPRAQAPMPEAAAAPAPAPAGLPRMESAAPAPSGLPRMESLPPTPAATANIGIARAEAIRAPPSAATAKPQPASSKGEVHARPASLWRRLLSFTIDTAAIAGVAALYITLASSVTGTKAPEAGLTGLDAFVGWLRALHTVLLPGFFLVLVLAVVYCAVAAFLWNGRTLGRLLLGLRLVDTHGLAPAPGRAIVRAMLSSLSFVLFLGGFWMALFDRRGQTLHDKLTSTFVVQPS
ncbi:RDD family protein [Pyxidicoccus trucidator]|uniref:RDD family protein n=1 Tax=Pyxidicoccus trucidator TaxID=2709662 RepID=UPI0023DDB3EB|nr:RDD family protein [Pyxidicoccus trucidator]